MELADPATHNRFRETYPTSSSDEARNNLLSDRPVADPLLDKSPAMNKAHLDAAGSPDCRVR
jgi:hypothetical protein